MGTLQDLPGELNLTLFVGRAVTISLVFPTSIAGRTFTASIDTGTAVVTPTVTVSTNTMSFPLTAANLASESPSGVLLITETTSGTVPYIAGRVKVTRNAGTPTTSATVTLATSTVNVLVGSWPSSFATFTTAVARDAAITSPTEGLRATLTTPDQDTEYDGAAWQVVGWYSSTGRITTRCRRTTNQSVANASETSILWDTEDVDSEGLIAVTGTTFTIPTGKGGMWVVSARATLASAVSSGRYFISINVTSSVTGLSASYRGGFAGEDSSSIERTFPLAAGDSWTISIFQTSGGAINCTSAWMQAVRVAP